MIETLNPATLTIGQQPPVTQKRSIRTVLNRADALIADRSLQLGRNQGVRATCSASELRQIELFVQRNLKAFVVNKVRPSRRDRCEFWCCLLRPSA